MSKAIVQFCNLCDRNIGVKKDSVSWFIVILLTFFTLIGGVLYYLYKTNYVKGACPICGNTNLLPADTKAQIARVNQ